MLRMRILGPVELRTDEGTLLRTIMGRPKLLALTAYLAAARSSNGMRRDLLLPLLWPDLDEPAARHALSQALSRLRSELGPHVLDGKYSDTIRLDRTHYWCDALAFREAADDGRLREAVELYSGPLLEGLHVRDAPEFERWLDRERRLLRRRATEAAIGLAAHARAEEAWDEAIRLSERSTVLDPYEEAAWRELIACLARSGNEARAVMAYQRMEKRFQTDLGMEPSEETRRILRSLIQQSNADTSSDSREPTHGSDPAPSAPQAPVATSVAGASPEALERARPAASRLLSTVTFVAAAVVIGLVLSSLFRGSSSPGNASQIDIRSLAVLPLVDLRPVETGDYLSASLTAELGHALSQIEGITVTSHGSARRYGDVAMPVPQIARELNVDAVIEGQVRRDGSAVRVILQLVDGNTDRRLWSEEYEVAFGSIPALQRRI